MSTAIAESIPATPEAPASTPSLATALYGGPAADAHTEPSTQTTPAQTQDTEPAPAKPDASPPAPAKPEDPPQAPEDSPEVKQLKDDLARQTAASKRQGRETAELKQQLKELMQKHDELIARANGEEPPKKAEPTAEQVAAQADFRGRERSSKAVAANLFGEKALVDVYGDDTLPTSETPYAQLANAKPWVHFEVTHHDQPAVAAIMALKREAFIQQYGDDPTKWAEKIVAAHKPKLFEEFQKQLTTPPVGSPVPSVTEARNAGGSTTKREKSLADYLYGGG